MYGGIRCSLSSPGSKPEVFPFTLINKFAESRAEEKNMEEKQIQIPDVNAGAEERDNYTLIQETPEDDLPGENGIAIRYSKDFNIVQANELLRS